LWFPTPKRPSIHLNRKSAKKTNGDVLFKAWEEYFIPQAALIPNTGRAKQQMLLHADSHKLFQLFFEVSKQFKHNP
jgi:hypothetical protein